MRADKEIEKLVEESLDSLDGIRRAEASPWFFTKVKAKIYKKVQPYIPFWLRPQLVMPLLVVLIAVNIYSVRHLSSGGDKVETPCEFAAWYGISSCGSLVY